MTDGSDIAVHLPVEHLAALSEVICTGLQRAKIDSKVRKELEAWWAAEHDLLLDEINESQNK